MRSDFIGTMQLRNKKAPRESNLKKCMTQLEAGYLSDRDSNEADGWFMCS